LMCSSQLIAYNSSLKNFIPSSPFEQQVCVQGK
jgi:hypothetical protein